MTSVIKRTNEEDSDFLSLVKLLDVELAERDGDEHAFYAQFNKPVGLSGVVVAYRDDEPVGCGAFRTYNENSVEIKRMYVRPDRRGLRIAADVLTELEKWAKEDGSVEYVLETGFKQPEAIALYKRSGYEVILNYGQYIGVENSVCMRKIADPKVS
ncbi:MAG: GNAT family N-acetyltransferase [Pyrinomonadaceae bacterium]